MALCILCGKHPTIDGSHIVPNFFVRALKRGTPIRHLVHSTDPARTEQDGWKGPYLCEACEGRLSLWEADLARVYREILSRTAAAGVIACSEATWLAVASIHFRWIHLARASRLSHGGSEFDVIYERLRTACIAATAVEGVHLYIAGLETTSTSIPSVSPTPRPGFNAYVFNSIDGGGFAYQDADGEDHVLCWVKPPGLCLVVSSGPLTSLVDHPGDVSAVALQHGKGTVTPFPLPSTFWKLFGPDWNERVEQIEAAYTTFTPERLKRIADWASSKDAPPQAAACHEADLELLKAQTAEA